MLYKYKIDYKTILLSCFFNEFISLLTFFVKFLQMINSIVQHSGVVQYISDNILEIRIISESACSSCKSKKICSISEIKEKMIYVNSPDNSIKVGDVVNVFLQEKDGAIAVIFAYVVPFLVMVTILGLGYHRISEPILGLLVLLSLAIYFLVLYLFRHQFSKRVNFKVEKLNKHDELVSN